MEVDHSLNVMNAIKNVGHAKNFLNNMKNKMIDKKDDRYGQDNMLNKLRPRIIFFKLFYTMPLNWKVMHKEDSKNK